jgi:penicillin amidase
MFPRFALGLGYIITLLLVGLLFLGIHFMSGTVPKYTGSASVAGIGANVQIDRDEYAIAHIHAATEKDAYFGLGYAEAQDRLFQMEFTRRIGQGRLSEIVGKKSYVVDAWAKTIGFSRIADQMWAKASPNTRDILTAYTNGINQFLDSHRNALGFEFDALKLQPDHWRPQDCMIIGRLMAWEMNFSYFTDAAFGDIALSLDSEHMRWLYPGYPDNGATVLEGADPSSFTTSIAQAQAATPIKSVTTAGKTGTTQKPAIPKTVTGTKPATPPASPAPGTNAAPKPKVNAPKPTLPRPPIRTGSIDRKQEAFFAQLREVQHQIDDLIGPHSGGGGSNSFVLAPSRTRTGGAMLENDIHLELRAPSRWYLVHMASDDGLNVAGFCVPGLPAILSGRNQNVSWGITNAMADESDFFIERLDSTRTHYIGPNGAINKFAIVYDSIRIQDSVKTNPPFIQTFPVRSTGHGPIVSDMHPFRVLQAFAGTKRAGGIPDTSFLESGQVVSLAWNGLYVLGDELGSFLSLAKARSIPEAKAAMTSLATPCLNLCLADASGNIAYQYVGRMPRRTGSEERILLPRDGSNPSDMWTGFIYLHDLPSMTNPPRGYIVSANNPPMRSRPFAYSSNWEPSSRADRISELIERNVRLDTASVKRIMTDIVSPYDLRRVLPYLLSLYPDPHPPRITADSTWVFKLDSMKIFWKEDSIHKHTQTTDSAFALIRAQDSAYLATRRPAEDTIKSAKVDPFTSLVLEYLRNWDGGMRPEEIAPTIYSVFLERLLENTFKDELGDKRYREFNYLSNIPLRTLTRILPDSANIWWDNVMTHGPVAETRDSIIQVSFRQSLRILALTFGRDLRTWQWGKLHTLTYQHPFGSSSPMIAKLVNIEGGAMPGGPTTVMQASYYLYEPYKMHVGPSTRMIADMKTQVLLAALPTGNSEAIFGDHYRDMMDIYKQGELIPVPLNERKDTWKRFELKPR